MITALRLISFAFGIGVFAFVVLSLASGLLYCAEWIEENTQKSKTFGIRATYLVITLLGILYFYDGLPIHLAASGIASHLVYLTQFDRNWPSVTLLSPKFIGSCILVVFNHFINFFYFQEQSNQSRSRRPTPSYSRYVRAGEPTFFDLTTFFGLCVWFIPLFLFLSLSANDSVLPTGSTRSTPSKVNNTHNRKGSSFIKSAFSFMKFSKSPSNQLPQSINATYDSSSHFSNFSNPSTPTRRTQEGNNGELYSPGLTPGPTIRSNRIPLSRRNTGDGIELHYGGTRDNSMPGSPIRFSEMDSTSGAASRRKLG